MHAKLTLVGSFSGHPWILFNTVCSLKIPPVESKLKHQSGAASQKVVAEPWLGGSNMHDGSLNDVSSPFSSSGSCNSEYHDDCVWIDELATAISHVRISEPKRNKLWGPTGPIDQQGSSNMKANLCKAF